MTHQQYGEIVPTHSKPEDRDSFSSLTTGAVRNWPLIALIAGAVFFVNNAITAGDNTDVFQTKQIEDNVEAINTNSQNIKQLDGNVQALNTSQVSSYNELIRKIDSLTASIEALKQAPK